MNKCPYCQAALSAVLRKCPRCGIDLTDIRTDQRVEGTVMEAVPDIFLSGGSVRRTPTVKESTIVSSDAIVFRPTLRPPLAVLCILDDGSQDIGEVIRIRSQNTVIGRSEGNVIIPHDTGMSARHAEISLRVEDGHYHWYLKDLDSRNGTFVRVAQSVLKDKQEILIGSRRLRFSAAREAAAPMTADSNGLPRNVTREWKVVSPHNPAARVASLVELMADGDGSCLMLNQQEHWLGADKSQCSLLIDNDIYVSPRHARLFKDERRRWHIENAGSVNGIWIRINEIQLHTRGDFQLGEQRFRFMIT